MGYKGVVFELETEGGAHCERSHHGRVFLDSCSSAGALFELLRWRRGSEGGARLVYPASPGSEVFGFCADHGGERGWRLSNARAIVGDGGGRAELMLDGNELSMAFPSGVVRMGRHPRQ